MKIRPGVTQRTSGDRPILITLLIAVVVLLANPELVSAQSPLEEVERLTRLGSTEQARAILLELREKERIEA